MTPNEFDYLKRAMTALESGQCSKITEIKILRIISQITGRAADKREKQFQDQVDDIMSRNHLVDVLSR